MTAKVKVLFVCMGNICRSPAGEGVFRHYADNAGYSEEIMVDSAGTIDYHAGNPADSRMREAASKRGYSLTSKARQVRRGDIENFNLIIAMDSNNLLDLEILAAGPKDHIRMLGSFLDGTKDNSTAISVPDPYYGGASGFEDVLDMIEDACPAILDFCIDYMKSKN